ncbi:membrane-bound metal-dependent hydrolase YbcI (DUF457 family) [Rhodopirellula rubra]|uniref:Membrane-bound metal-dependent hydrolase YbcI (DUF457 family) n=1 Tax=Aporhodopirellula rubra TaxID=980271 RepID=A0A7W5DZ83_9BACT|nr:metal-dependent hydrolase [Aporhodopirellula rubra]MBB3206914.1 membrane-bound metal-dependent hydrolase YbcI (DUF457 family) [Aporhodopirellula rubra]
MDILTHALMGTAIATPCMVTMPEASAALILGSVAPDLDAFSRIFGKRAFMQWHQTFTHSIGVIGPIAMIGLVTLLVDRIAGFCVLAFAVGMAFHVALDYTNTLGVKCWYPISRKRYCSEWCFFIDLPLISITLLFLCWLAWLISRGVLPHPLHACIYLAIVVGYFGFKAWTRHSLMQKIHPPLLSLIPSAWCPWLFYSFRHNPCGSTELLNANAIRGTTELADQIPGADEHWIRIAEQSEEFQIMKELSAGYKIISVQTIDDPPSQTAAILTCRDLRTRNFSTSFGSMEITVDSNATVSKVDWNV